jgi:hypothetical protein
MSVSKTEVKSDNALIAEFMGIEVDPVGTTSYDVNKRKRVNEADLNYEESWSELMPVVEKISNTYSYDSSMRDDVIYLPVSSSIDDVYKAVVEFIKWYNQNSKP